MKKDSIVIPESMDDNDSPQEKCRESGRKFEIRLLPADLQRVYHRLNEECGEQYALTVVFAIRTAVELHRAWHMSLLTANILRQIKEKFDLHLSWNLGVIDLNFRIEDGLYELHRRVPYDYDSEYQNLYWKTAVALVEGHIGVHDALIFQKELKEGKHTSPSGLFFRSNPGRLVLYPIQAATCCLVFFGGDYKDAGISSLCGITAGLIEWALSSKRIFPNVNESKMLIDFVVGLSTGIIGGLFWKLSNDICLSSIFSGTLYWFFYGTAFVIGLLEIIAGELQTGVTRFLAVSVKTFVLSVGSALGLTIVLTGSVYDVWVDQQNEQCNVTELEVWRIPIYILCSLSVLGQYRFIIMDYLFGLIVQLAAYEVQYILLDNLDERHRFDGIDTVASNILGAMVGVAVACFVAYLADYVKFQGRIVSTDDSDDKQISSMVRKLSRKTYKILTRVCSCLHLGRGLIDRSSEVHSKLEEQSRLQAKTKDEIKLDEVDEAILVEDAVEAEGYNVWSLLMPAVYQLVPGSKLAMYWYDVIFPPRPIQYSETSDLESESPEFVLWYTSVSLALGLILGLAIVRVIVWAILTVFLCCIKLKSNDKAHRVNSFVIRQFGRQAIANDSVDNDPDDGRSADLSAAESEPNPHGGLRNRRTGISTV